MKKIKVLLLFMLLMCGSMSIRAQFGISVIDNVVDAAAGMVGANKGNPHNPGGSSNSGSSKGGGSKGSANTPDPGHGEGAGKWKPVPTVVVKDKDFCWECVSPSYDGIFFVKVGYKNMYRFYRTKGGEPVSRSVWKANSEPRFNNGVCAVQSAASRRWYILKSNGDSIALDPSIKMMTNFLDGVAIAGDYGKKYFINDKGQRVFPNAVPDEFEIYPLIDGTRRMFHGQGGYGYIDAHGNVVIKPQYAEARNFGGGWAIVYDATATQNKYWVIDNMGKKVSEIPSKYAKVSWTRNCYVSDFVHSAAVAKNEETGKYDIISPKMDIKASFDDASPFCRKSVPSDAAVCVVKNNDWEYPQFCNTNGTVLDQYENPMKWLKRPTQPWYETYNDKNEKTVRMPSVFSGYSHVELYFNAKDAWGTPRWEYTGINVSGGNLATDKGFLFDYHGVLGMFNWKYTKPDSFSADGHAKCNMKSTKEWRKQVSRWIEELEDHMVFVNTDGEITVEIVHQPE